MEISFPDGYQYDSFSVYKFVAVVDGRRVTCLVSVEALQDNFGATDEVSYRSVLEANKALFERIAEAKIRTGQFEPDGRIGVSNEDIKQRLT